VTVVRWTREALDDLDDILAYIERDSPAAAIDLVETIIASGNALKIFPARNPVRHEGDIRERPILGTRYVLCYVVENDDLVHILCVRHGARSNRTPRRGT
jgi:addiction module RelE/StbE family toxin